MKRDYNDPIYSEWRKRVFKRDKCRCQMPSCGSKRRPNAHHIQRWADQPYLRYDVDNGITLCYSCHKRITGNESAYAGLFSEIVRGKDG
jgi:hypothetical protein